MSAAALTGDAVLRVDRRSMALLSTAHACADLCQGAVPALLPFLIAQRGLSLTAAAALITAATIGGSIVQPLFGLVADRLSAPVLVPLGVLVASVGLGLSGLCGSYAALAAVLLAGGLGVAAFHPEGARYASYVSGAGRGRGMSYFSVGGNLGFALGPALVTPVVAGFGLGATPLLALPGLVVGLLVLADLRRLRSFVPERPLADASDEDEPEAWWPFTRLAGAAVARTVAFFSLQAFVPLFLIRHLGAGTGTGGAALTTMLLAGAVGTLIGGRCADRFGRRVVLVWAMLPMIPLLAVLPHVGVAAAFVVLVGIGLCVDSPFAITIVMGQEYLPRRMALSSGITYGLAIGLGGLGATGMGALADATSLTTALAVLPLFAVVALGLAATLPSAQRSAAGQAMR